MADTIKSIKPAGGGDYSSLEAWEAGQQKSIAVGDREIGEFYAGADNTSGNPTINGWTIPSGAQLILRTPTAERHTLKRGTGYRLVSSGAFFALNIAQDYVTVDGLAFRHTNTSTGGGGESIRANTVQALRFLNCFVESDLPDGATFNCNVSDIANRDAVVANCVFIKNNASATVQTVILGGDHKFYNNVAINLAGQPALYSQNVANNNQRVKNCYLHSTGANVYGFGFDSATFTTCKHSTSQALTGSTGSVAYSTAQFTNVSAGTEDFNLVGGSALLDAGTDLSADANYAFSTDYTGATRSGTWDIGPAELLNVIAMVAPGNILRAGRASPNFSVTASGSISGTLTVTPSDGGAGGSFTPSSLGLTSGSPSGTFTYTPGAGGAVTISVTNSGGFTNPSSVGYSALAAGAARNPGNIFRERSITVAAFRFPASDPMRAIATARIFDAVVSGAAPLPDALFFGQPF